MDQGEPEFLETTLPASRAAFLDGGGEMSIRMRALDWSSTPVGEIEQWPQSLMTSVAICLRSRFPIVIWWDRKYYTMFYNDAYIPALGKTKHPGWLGRPGYECWKEIWSTVGPMLEGVFTTGQPTWSEDMLLVMDRNLPQEEVYFTFSYSAIPGDSGAVDGIFCACTETTRRVLGERRLRTLRDLASRASEARSAEEACEVAAHVLAQNDADIPFALIYLLNRERTVAHLVALSGLARGSAAAVENIQLSRAPGRGIWPLDRVVRKARPALVKPLAGDFGTLPGGPWPESPDSALVLPLIAPSQNEVTGFLVVGVNPRCLLDEPYRDFFNLVAGHVATGVANARAYEEERKRAEALAEIDRAKTTFFSNVSHEFRTPLTLMLGPIEEMLAEDHALAPEQRKRTATLHRNALRLLKLVNALLDFSRLEAGRVEAVYVPTDLATLTTDLASSFRAAIEKAGMVLRVDCPPLDAPVYVDREMWEKVVLNLLSNAFRYTFNGSITVALQQKETAVELSVTDTGTGIPAAELPHMFERFHRIKGTRGRTHEGTGIGLSLVQELVKLHEGTVSVQSAPGKGSTFTVSLPLGTAHLPKDRIAATRTLPSTAVQSEIYVNEALRLLSEQEAVVDTLSKAVPGSAPVQRGRKAGAGEQPPRILFADDNADMREYVSRLLRARYDVRTVSDGQAALAAVKEYRPDLVLTDVMMPGMDGFELLQALRCATGTRALPVILLSARAGEEAQIEGLAAGADDYLIKPFSARELLARVGAHLEMARLRREVEERVEAERQRLHSLLMQAPALIAVLRGPDHIFELANPLYMQAFGLRRKIIGKKLQEAFPEVEGQGFFEMLNSVYRTGEPLIGNKMLARVDRKGDGRLEERYFDFICQPLRNVRCEIDSIIFHAVDVTDQKRAEDQLKESMEHLKLLEKQKDDFLGIASHELKTPVTSVRAYTQLLERRFRNAGDERSSELLLRMDAQLSKLIGLIGDLLDVTRIEGGQVLLHSSSFDFNTLINEIVEEMQRTTQRHAIAQDLAESVTISADRERIGQVLTNLLTNAIKYSPRTSTIQVKTLRRAGAIITSVQDYGIGIAREKQAHLFERFSRIEGDARLTYPGLGLGLYISADFVKRHHGSIWVESEAGEGATFSFSLPLQQPQED